MLKIFSIFFCTMGMPKEAESIRKEARRMGALIWGLFILTVTFALERESFFS